MLFRSEIECLVPKLDIQVFGTGGSRRAGEQAAARLALEAVQNSLVKTPVTEKKTRQRAAQLKLAGIATFQPDAPTGSDKSRVARVSVSRGQEERLLDVDEASSRRDKSKPA